MAHENNTHETSVGYGGYVLVWLTLLGLTVTTVAVAGLDLSDYTLFIAMVIAAIKSVLVINIFMHIKFDELIFKAFWGITILILFAVFFLTAFDLIYR